MKHKRPLVKARFAAGLALLAGSMGLSS
ncbi:hypothetical protein MNBD_GAMMA15-680, partial [hydrothermal vent metagenome]